MGPTGEATTRGDLRRLHRATEFTAALAATDLHWPDLAQAVVDHTSRLVGDGVGLFLFPEPAGPLALQAAGHHRASERRETWVDLAPLADLVAHLLSEADPTRPEPRLVDVDRDPLLRAGSRGGWTSSRTADGDAERTSVLVAPLTVGGATLGALVIARDPFARPFERDDLELTADLASRASIALHDARLVHGARADARAAAESDAVARAILRSAPDAVIVIDDEGRIESINPAAESLSGYSADELVGQGVDLLIPGARPSTADTSAPPADFPTQRTPPAGVRCEIDLRRRDGSEEPVELSMSEVQLGDRRLYVGIARDLGRRREEERELRAAAQADNLTGLVNRASFHRALSQRLEHDGLQPFALLFLDLDGFKEVNDTFGHPVGDRVLQEVAGRLTVAVRRHDLVARYGGDEFVVVVDRDHLHDARHEARIVAERMRRSFDRPFEVEGHAMTLGVSVGTALHPDDGHTISALIAQADRAMYEEKRSKRPRPSP